MGVGVGVGVCACVFDKLGWFPDRLWWLVRKMDDDMMMSIHSTNQPTEKVGRGD